MDKKEIISSWRGKNTIPGETICSAEILIKI